MLVPERKQVAYDPSRYIDIETVDEAVAIITTETEGLSAQRRWNEETPALIALMEPYLEPGSLVLDYGCGIGRLAKPLIEKCSCQVVGVDISPNMRALAASCVNSASFTAMDPVMFDALFQYSSIKFDAAIAVWALQHCIDLDRAIARIRDQLTRGGHLIVVNNTGRCVPVEGGEWADDGVDTHRTILAAGFEQVTLGQLAKEIAPGWMREGTYWAVYRWE
jgi:SAM-dependent methyltransferase